MKARLATFAAALAALFVFVIAPSTARAQIEQVTEDIRVISATHHDVSPALRSVDISSLPTMVKEDEEGEVVPNTRPPVEFFQRPESFVDPALQRINGTLETDAPIVNFDALDVEENGGRLGPPDPNMEVGDNFIVEMVNLVTAVYDKQGNIVDGPFPNNALWDGFGGACETQNAGDPIVVYDQVEDRWILSQFANVGQANGAQCVAISVTDDPAGEYFRYEFPTPSTDYPKMGVGTEAYYISWRELPGMSAGAVDKEAMLAGEDAAIIAFGPDLSFSTRPPADIDGALPPADTPHPFAGLQQDAIEIFGFDPDFDNPGNSTFESLADIDVDPFDSQLCTAFRGQCIPQPSGPDLESLSGVLMHRLNVRDLGDEMAMVAAHTVDVDGNGLAGVRWYEFRDDGSGWSLRQQGTYAPEDGDFRFMPSIAINQEASIALGYTVSSDVTNPAIRYTGRPSDAPLGQMIFEEQSIFESDVSKTGGTQQPGRWGDYQAMVVDASDNNTFWFNGEYAKDIGGVENWGTRAASFVFDADDPAPPGQITDLSAEPEGENVELTWTAPADDAGDPESGAVTSYDIRFSTEGAIEDSSDFESATALPNPPAPAEPGTEQSYTAELDFDTQYWFAIRAVDELGQSSLSNSPSATTGPAPTLAFSPDSLVATLETNDETTLPLTLSNEGPPESQLDFTFPAFAAENLLENTPESQHNDVSRPIDDASYTDKANDPHSGVGNPVPLGAGGPDDFGYEWIDSNEPGGPVFEFVDISDTGTDVDLGDDDSETVPLPFTFEFYGTERSEITIGSNGYLTFGTDGTDFSNDPIPTATLPNAIIAPFWDDLAPQDGSGQVDYLDDAANDRFIVQYTDVQEFFGSPDETFTFQVIINDDGSLVYQYDDVEGGGDLQSATVGIENDDGSDGLQVAFNNSYVEDGLAVAIAATPEFIADVEPASGTISGGSSQEVDVTLTAEDIAPGVFERGLALVTNDPEALATSIPVQLTVGAGDPDIAVNPQSLDFGEVLVGDTATMDVTISNDGAGPLEVTDVSTDSDVFTANVDSAFTIPFSDSASVDVTFTPDEVQTYSGTLSIESNDPDEGTVEVPLSGEGVPAPVIAVEPDSLSETLEIGEMSTQTLTVSNTGGSDLDVMLSVDFSGNAPDVTFDGVDTNYPRGSGETSAGVAPEGRQAAGAPAGVPLLEPTGSIGFGANALSGTESELVSFDVGEPGDITVIADGPGGGFNGAGVVGPDASTAFHIVGTTLWEQSTETGDLTNLGSFSAGQDFSGMTYDPSTDTYYGLTTDISTSVLYELDVEAVSATEIGAVSNLPGGIALATGPDGQLFAYGIINDNLVSINEETGDGTVVGAIGFDANFAQGMEFDIETGMMYMAAFNGGTFQPEFRAVNLTTGSTTLIGVLDADQISWNATQSVVSGFLELAETDLTVAPGESEDVEVTFDATGLDAGTFNADIELMSNDPENSLVEVPATLEVLFGDPDIAVDPEALDYGEVLVGAMATQSVTIFNNGNGPLEVTDVSTDSDVFTANVDSAFTIPLGDSASVSVTFSPDAVQTYSGTLSIESNDPDEGTVTVDLSGEGVPAPVIAVEPDSLSEDVQLGTTATDSLIVSNNGDGTLDFTVGFDEDDGNALQRSEVAAPTSASGFGGVSGDAYASATPASTAPSTPVPLQAEDADYQLDDGTSENSLGLTNGGDIMWMNAFEAIDGSANIGTIYTAYGATIGTGLPDNRPATAYVYEDPNDDGNPDDAELVAQADFELQDPHTDEFTSVDLGGASVDGTFFIAVLVEDHAAGLFPAPIDESSGSMMSSWIVGNGTGDFDDEDLTNNSVPPDLLDDIGFPGNFMIRADGGGTGGGGFPDWISVSPTEGTVAPGDSTELTVTYDATDQELGTLSGDIEIMSNDPETPVAEVPVTLNVIAAPYPFELSPEEITATIDKTAGDTTETEQFTIENITDEEQFFLIETRGVSGNTPVFQNFITEEARREYELRAERLAGLDAPSSETSMGPAPGSAPARSIQPAPGRILAPTGVIAHSSSVFGDLSGQFVQFDLGEPSNLTPFGASPTVFAGDFAPSDDEVFFVVDNATNAFLSVDPETGETTQVGTATPNSGESWSELAGDPSNGTLYGSAASAAASTLYTLDPETGEATEVADVTLDGAPVPFIIGIAIDGDGQMYGYEIVNDTFLEIDKETGEATTLGPIGFDANFAQGLDYDLESGTMYMAAYNNLISAGELRTVDLDDGSTTLVGPLGSGDELGYMALPSGGFMFIDTDLLSGTLAPGGDVTIDANLDAEGLIAGTYEAEIVVISDEPGMPEDFIPVTLTVIDDPEVTLQPMALDFGEVFVGGDTTGTISVVNTGGDDLSVSDIQVTPDVFSIPDSAETEFTLEPTEARSFAVTFAPDAVQEYEGSFTVISDDPAGDVSATLTGEGIAAPVLAVDPESFDIRASVGETFERILEVTNTGGNPLTYQIMPELVSTPGNAPEPDVVFEDVLLEEDFNDGIPSDWTVEDIFPGEVTWALNTTWNDDNYTGGDGTAAGASSFPEFPGAQYDTRLITPEVTATAADFSVEFKMNFQEFLFNDTLAVDISTDGGDNWENVETYGNDVGTLNGDGETLTLPLGDFVEEDDTFQLRWRYFDLEGNDNWYAQVDDVVISRQLEFLTVDPNAGTLAPSETDSVSLAFNTNGLTEGLYEVDLNITSNDPTQDTTVVPVDLEVIEELVVTPEPGPDSTRTVVPGETFNIPITVESLDELGVESYEFTLSFASALFEPVGVETEGTLSEDVVLAVNTDVEGQISVAASDTSANAPQKPVLFDLEGDGTLLNVTLQAKEELGTSDVVFTEFIFNEGTPPAATEQTSYEVAPLFGDATLNGEVTALDAATVLDFTVGNVDLSDAAQTSADVTGNGTVGALDASLIFDFVLGEIDCFPVEEDCDTSDLPVLASASSGQGSGQSSGSLGTLAWGEMERAPANATSGGGAQTSTASANGPAIQVPLRLEGSGAVRAVELHAQIDADKVVVESVEMADELPEGWQMAQRSSPAEGMLSIALAGTAPLPSGQKLATVTLRWLKAEGTQSEKQLSLGGEAVLNETPKQQVERTQVSVVPDEFALPGNYPNPFRNTTTIAVNLPSDAKVHLDVYDALGRRILAREQQMQAGTGRTFEVNAASMAAGVYLYRVRAETEGGEEFTATGRMILVR